MIKISDDFSTQIFGNPQVRLLFSHHKTNKFINMEYLKLLIEIITKVLKQTKSYPIKANDFETCRIEQSNAIHSKTAVMLKSLEDFLQGNYEFRFNQLSETTEFRTLTDKGEKFKPVTQRDLNSFCQSAQEAGIECWARDVARFVNSNKPKDYHPFTSYMENLPEWDGRDRIAERAKRVSDKPHWIKGFHRWMLGMAACWMQTDKNHANSVAPILVSRKQGMHKSTFCKLIIPEELRAYYTDSVDLNATGAIEQKLALFGLINIDEFDKIPEGKHPLLKNLMQMSELNIRKAYQKNFRPLPRIASFIGTSNRKDLLTDTTGSRRFLCVEIENKIDISPIDYNQLYAQLKTEILSGERTWFTTDEEAEIQQSNLAFYKQNVEEELFFSGFRPAEKSGSGELLSSAEIFRRLRKRNPAAMRGITLRAFSRSLSQIGIKRVHTRYGNVYEVVEV